MPRINYEIEKNFQEEQIIQSNNKFINNAKICFFTVSKLMRPTNK